MHRVCMRSSSTLQVKAAAMPDPSWIACRGHADVALLADNANDMFAEEVRWGFF